MSRTNSSCAFSNSQLCLNCDFCSKPRKMHTEVKGQNCRIHIKQQYVLFFKRVYCKIQLYGSLLCPIGKYVVINVSFGSEVTYLTPEGQPKHNIRTHFHYIVNY